MAQTQWIAADFHFLHFSLFDSLPVIVRLDEGHLAPKKVTQAVSEGRSPFI